MSVRVCHRLAPQGILGKEDQPRRWFSVSINEGPMSTVMTGGTLPRGLIGCTAHSDKVWCECRVAVLDSGFLNDDTATSAVGG